jgi:23S rRNA (uracil1939-C5)-methyltransferase
MAKAGCKVTAIEETPSSIADAHENALINSLQHINFHAGRAETVLPQLESNGTLNKVDVMTVNPSRRGCQPEVLKALAALKPRALAYMSCNPDTLIRDLRQLEQLGYQARAFELYDMFPGSRHYEVVTLLTPV